MPCRVRDDSFENRASYVVSFLLASPYVVYTKEIVAPTVRSISRIGGIRVVF